MADHVRVELVDQQVQAAFSELVRRATNLSPVMADIDELLLESTKARFGTGTGPDGVRWKPLADRSGRAPLVKTGTMRDQIFPSSGPDFAEISATAKQAAWHQFGVRPYQVETRDHGFIEHPGIPARPFFGLSPDDVNSIVKLAGEYLIDPLV
jgi:phage virion morphogenesis protein